jgi:hypothetical protein
MALERPRFAPFSDRRKDAGRFEELRMLSARRVVRATSGWPWSISLQDVRPLSDGFFDRFNCRH